MVDKETSDVVLVLFVTVAACKGGVQLIVKDENVKNINGKYGGVL